MPPQLPHAPLDLPPAGPRDDGGSGPGPEDQRIPPTELHGLVRRMLVEATGSADPGTAHRVAEDLQRLTDGFERVKVKMARMEAFAPTRLDPDHPWVKWTVASLAKTSGKKPAILPNLGGTVPNDIFADIAGVPTIWVPHSYPSCSQHAPDEHMLGSVAREGLMMMAGLFWDLGEKDVPARA